MDGWRRWILIGFAVMATTFAAIVAANIRPLQPTPVLPTLHQDLIGPGSIARTAPDFRLRSFAGGVLALSDFRGQAVVLNFWASWCIPCREEMPILERVWREFRHRGVAILGVDAADDFDDAAAFLKRLQITYANVYDPEQNRLQTYRVTGLPTTVFLDTHLRIRAQVAGGYVAESGYQQLRAQIQTLLSAPR
jgi:peroxiredoxin